MLMVGNTDDNPSKARGMGVVSRIVPFEIKICLDNVPICWEEFYGNGLNLLVTAQNLNPSKRFNGRQFLYNGLLLG